MANEVILDELDNKLIAAFPGGVVRKDLVKKIKVGFNIPVYVLEYLRASTVRPPMMPRFKQGFNRSRTPFLNA